MIKKSQDIERIIKKKKRVGNEFFVLYNEINETNEFRFAISIGKKFGNAVARNKMKRQIREIMRKNFSDFLNYNLVIVVKKEANQIDFSKTMFELQFLFNKLKEKKVN